MTKVIKVYRHWDLLLHATDEEIKAILQSKEDNCVLDWEVSWHHHRVGAEWTVAVCEPTVDNRYYRGRVSIPEKVKTTITHEEHAPIELEWGQYDAWVQREYSPLNERKVMD